jgi:hypothetical protein
MAALAAAAAYAGWASGIAPFTVTAYVAVSVPSALFLSAFGLAWRLPDEGPWARLPEDRPPFEGTVVPWALLVALLVATELASYFHPGPRALYPTISSGADALFRHRPATAAAFLVWLAGGWYLVKR